MAVTLTKEEIIVRMLRNNVAIGLFTTLAGVDKEGQGAMTTGYLNFYALCDQAADETINDAGYSSMTDETALAFTLQNISQYVSGKVADYIVVYPTI